MIECIKINDGFFFQISPYFTQNINLKILDYNFKFLTS